MAAGRNDLLELLQQLTYDQRRVAEVLERLVAEMRGLKDPQRYVQVLFRARTRLWEVRRQQQQLDPRSPEPVGLEAARRVVNALYYGLDPQQPLDAEDHTPAPFQLPTDDSTFQVINTEHSAGVLIGRKWLRAIGAVPWLPIFRWLVLPIGVALGAIGHWLSIHVPK